LKLGISNLEFITDDYLVWDADTIPLKPIKIIDKNGKYNFVKADEYHKPYFENFKILLNEEPNREFSFISQFMIFNKSILNELFRKIEKNFKDSSHWYWSILQNLKGEDGSLFSEYETYGHFIKNHYPDKCNFINIPWLRNGTEVIGTPFPNKFDLMNLEKDYYYVTFELRSNNLVNKLKKHLITKIYPYKDFLLKLK
jgi:hypothetical protein